MSIILHTGLPGACKTLYTISFVKAWAERENRQVYYHGIAELTLDWIPLEDPTKWYECPPNSIIVLDEAQQTYRNRSIRAEAPRHVTELETHRHLGLDLVFVTQHPKLIDPAVRALVQTHRHMVRMFGMEAATVHTWNGVKEACDKSRADSEKKKWVFDKSIFELYKSAEVHTMKRRIPARVIFLFVMPLLLALAAYAVYAIAIKPKTSPEVVSAVQAQPEQDRQVQNGFQGSGASSVIDPIQDARKFAFEATPRVAGVAHTAPKYDELTKPSSVPVPAICIIRATRCQCYTQQATKLQVETNTCLDIAHNGYFQEFEPDRSSTKNGPSKG